MSQQEKRMDVEDILLRSFAEASHGGSLDERIKAGDEVLETFQLTRQCEVVLDKLAKKPHFVEMSLTGSLDENKARDGLLETLHLA
eukprot:5105727-Pleurochrysis_carterae.AAC.1